MKLEQILILSLACAFTTACGDDGGGGATTSTVEDPQTIEAGKTAASRSVELGTFTETTDGAGAQGVLSTVGSSLQAWAGRHQATQAMARSQALTAEAIDAVEQAQTANEFSYADGRLSANINYDGAGAGGTVSYHYEVELDIGETADGGRSLDGTFNIDFAVTNPQYDIAYTYDATYDAMATDAEGCAVAGSITLIYDLDISGGVFDSLPAEQRSAISGQLGAGGTLKATFGPACGDIAVEGT